ncbi:MAG: hypothetical protein JW983_04010 [Elusimicrobia bacterium]|nr:hypothetical protein [Elusimicrobiota bacterium]
MRAVNFGVIPNISRTFSKDVSLDMFRRMCLAKYFDLGLVEAVKGDLTRYLVYLSLGQEATAAAISKAVPEYMLFTQHRCHATYLAFGGDPAKLRDELLGLSTGTSGGRAGSNCIQCHGGKITMFGHHGLIGENVPLGVGAAFGSRKPTICFFGDGAAEEDYVFVAMGFAVTHKLPVLFVCEDNDLSILTPTKVRRSWSMTKVANALGMPAMDIADDPWTIFKKIQKLKCNLPAFINIYACRANWHVGVGTDGPPEWDRFKMVKNELKKLGLEKQIIQIEKKIQDEMEKLWDKKRLQKLLKK